MHFAIMVIIMMAMLFKVPMGGKRIHRNIVAHCSIPIR